jgi:leucyl-tRNA synthetase
MGDYASAAPWSESSVKGCKRFLERVADLPAMVKGSGVTDGMEALFHKTIKKVTQDIEELKFNTAVASLMTLINEIESKGSLTSDELSIFVRLLSPFAPHLCEEIWENMGNTSILSIEKWPIYDESKTVDDVVKIAVQVNGKLKATIDISKTISKEDAISCAKAEQKVDTDCSDTPLPEYVTRVFNKLK